MIGDDAAEEGCDREEGEGDVADLIAWATRIRERLFKLYPDPSAAPPPASLIETEATDGSPPHLHGIRDADIEEDGADYGATFAEAEGFAEAEAFAAGIPVEMVEDGEEDAGADDDILALLEGISGPEED
jgi:hypothetical protein